MDDDEDVNKVVFNDRYLCGGSGGSGFCAVG